MTRRRAALMAAGVIATGLLAVVYAYAGVVVRWPRKALAPLYIAEVVQGRPAPDAPPDARWTDPEPGGYYVGSPDGRFLALTRDSRRAYHTVFVWDERTRRLHPVVSIQEGDPGSGASHRYRWTADSRALLISGWGSLPLHGVENPLSYVYVVEEDVLYRGPHGTRID